MSRATDQRVFEALSEVGIPGTRHAWEDGTKPPLPWFVYGLTNDGTVHASDRNYAALPRYRAEVHSAEYDVDLLEAFERAISRIGPFTFDEGWDADDAEFIVAYEFTLA